MRTTAKVDYAVRAAVALARAEAEATARGETVEPTKSHLLAASEEIPPKFLESILADLKRAHVVTSRRGGLLQHVHLAAWIATPARRSAPAADPGRLAR